MEKNHASNRPAPEYKLKTPKVIEESVVGTYKKIEEGVVGTYKKIEGKFVDTFLEKVEPEEKH